MNYLQKEFEKTGYASYINSDIYPDGKIYTKEYTEWLEKKVKNNIDLADVSQQRKHVITDFVEKYNKGLFDLVWQNKEYKIFKIVKSRF